MYARLTSPQDRKSVGRPRSAIALSSLGTTRVSSDMAAGKPKRPYRLRMAAVRSRAATIKMKNVTTHWSRGESRSAREKALSVRGPVRVSENVRKQRASTSPSFPVPTSLSRSGTSAPRLCSVSCYPPLRSPLECTFTDGKLLIETELTGTCQAWLGRICRHIERDDCKISETDTFRVVSVSPRTLTDKSSHLQ